MRRPSARLRTLFGSTWRRLAGRVLLVLTLSLNATSYTLISDAEAASQTATGKNSQLSGNKRNAKPKKLSTKSTNVPKKSKRQAKNTQSPTPLRAKQKTSSAPGQKREAPPPKVTAKGFQFSAIQLLQGGLALAIALMLWWRRHVRTRINSTTVKSGYIKPKLDEDDPRHVAAEIDILTRNFSGNIKLKEKDAAHALESQQRHRHQPALLPENLADHFTGWGGEIIEWHASYKKKHEFGVIAFTNRRLLALQHTKTLSLIPPGITTVMHRQQHDVAHITTCHSGRGRFEAFLWLGLLTVLWFPLGTIMTCLALIAYFAVTRPELVIGTAEIRHHYPLPPGDHQKAITALAQVQERRHADLEGRAAS